MCLRTLTSGSQATRNALLGVCVLSCCCRFDHMSHVFATPANLACRYWFPAGFWSRHVSWNISCAVENPNCCVAFGTGQDATAQYIARFSLIWMGGGDLERRRQRGRGSGRDSREKRGGGCTEEGTTPGLFGTFVQGPTFDVVYLQGSNSESSNMDE